MTAPTPTPTADTTPFFWLRRRWAIAVTALLLLAYITIWERSLYFDDYVHILGRTITFPARPLAEVMRVFMLYTLPDTPAFLIALRVTITALIGLTSLLLGWLVLRLSHSRFAALVTLFLSLAPVHASQGIVYLSAIASYVPSVTTLLGAWHFYLTFLDSEARQRRWLALTLVLIFFSSLFIENAALLGLAGLPFLYLFRWQRNLHRSWFAVMGDLALPLALGVVIVLASFGGQYVNNTRMQGQFEYGRGGLNLSIEQVASRGSEYIERFLWMVASPDWGQRLIGDAISFGWRTVSSSAISAILLIVSIGTVHISADGFIDRIRSPRPYLLIAFGLFWLVFSMLLPGILLANQILEYRMLYLPYLGLCVAVGALAAVIHIRRWIGQLIILIAGLTTVVSAVGVVGFARAYEVRYAADRILVDDFARQLPFRSIDPQSVYLVPYQIDYDLPDVGTALNREVLNVFEAAWTFKAALIPYFDAADALKVIASNRWRPLTIAPDPADPIRLLIAGFSVPTDQLILFTVQDDRIKFIRNLTFGSSTGEPRLYPLTYLDEGDQNMLWIERLHLP